MHYFGWQGKPAEMDSQIGQLPYYLTAVQLRRLRAYVGCQSPPQASPVPPAPVLGLFMEAEMVYTICIYIHLDTMYVYIPI